MLTRRQFSSLVVSASAGAVPSVFGAADAFPSRPIELIVGYGAGGVVDMVGRAIALPLAKLLGQPVVITNRPGAGGTLGPATMAAKDKPDGYTLAFIAMSIGRQPLMQKTSWDPLKDFTYISMLTDFTMWIAVPADSPFKSLADLLAYAKAHPGEVTYAALGPGTGMHLSMERIAQQARVSLSFVPFARPADVLQAVLGHHVMVQVDASSWAQHVDSGKMRLLAMGTDERSKKWPTVPTLRELGFHFNIDGPFGIAGPAGMDPAIVRKLDAAFAACMQDQGVLRALDFYDMRVNYLGPTAYHRYMEDKIKSEGELLEFLGLRRKA